MSLNEIEIRDERIISLVEAAGFDKAKDALLFEYVNHWLKNNQFRPGTIEELSASLLQSVGVELYKVSGEIPDIDD